MIDSFFRVDGGYFSSSRKKTELQKAPITKKAELIKAPAKNGGSNYEKYLWLTFNRCPSGFI